jgi:hypothetical protein
VSTRFEIFLGAPTRVAGVVDAEGLPVQEALDHLLDGGSRIGARDWARGQAQSLVDPPCSPGRRHLQRALAEPLICRGEK